MSAADTTVITTRIDASLRAKLEALARSTRRSKSFLAAEAIAAYVELNEWQIGEITAGIQELDSGEALSERQAEERLIGYCSHGDASSPGVCSRLFSPTRRHSRAHCGGQPNRGDPHDRANSRGGDALGGISGTRPTGSRGWHA